MTKIIEDELRKSEEKYRSLVESTSDWIWEIDIKGIYVYSSPKAKELIGYEPSEIIGKTPFDFMLPTEAKRVGEKFKEISKAKEPFSRLENINIHKDGSRVVVETSGVPIFDEQGNLLGWRGIDRDITNRKKVELELSIAEERYRILFDSLREAVVTADIDSGIIVDCNLAAEKLFGKARSQIIGKHQTTLHPEDSGDGRFRESYEGYFFNKGTIISTKIVTATGEIRDVEIKSAIITIGEKKFLNGLFIDVTERNKNQREKEDLQKQLFQADRLASIGTLAAGVAHEVNNPLAIVIGLQSILKESLTKKGLMDENTTKTLDSQNRALFRIANIISGLKTFARENTDTIEDVDLHQIIKDTLNLVEGLYKKEGISFENILARDSAIVRVEVGKMQQVVMNIISNAKDAILSKKSGGLIRLETRKKGENVCLRISDNGSGIPKDILARIFEPFFTTKATGKGTGLGLSISLGIISSFHGKIEVESEVGTGTTFNITLPISPVKNSPL